MSFTFFVLFMVLTSFFEYVKAIKLISLNVKKTGTHSGFKR